MASYGCGSSGGGSAPTPNGIYTGTITGGNSSFNGIGAKGIIYEGRFLLFSSIADGPVQVFDGDLTTSDYSLSGSGQRYIEAVFNNTNSIGYDGSFVDGQSATIDFIETGTSSPTLSPGTFNLTKSGPSFYQGSDANKLDGTWTGSYAGTFPNDSLMDLTIDASGTINSGGDQAPHDCVLTGTILPADISVNAYDANITSDGGTSNCNLPAGDYTGLAWTEGDTNGTLVLMFTNGTNSRAVVLTRN